MFEFAVPTLRRAFGRAAAAMSGPAVALTVCYAAGLAASRLIGDGAVGQPLLGFAAPLAIGVLIRHGRSLGPTEALRLGAVALAFGAASGETLPQVTWDLARDLGAVAVGAAAFVRLRALGFISSQVRVAAAVAIASAAGSLVGAAFEAPGLWSGFALDALAAAWIAGAVGSALVIGVVLAHDRADEPLADACRSVEDAPPALSERISAACLISALTLGCVGGGPPEMALAASAALIWFALRLGLFATSLAALSFAAAMLAFAWDGLRPSFLGSSDPIAAELLRYLALALLTGPSVLVAAAVHDQMRMRRMLAHRAMHDGMTKLVNRARFHELLTEASAKSAKDGRRFALMLIDLDHFKTVNDSFGHIRGDALLIEVSERLRNSVRATDIVARIGGDEFAVVAPVRTVDDAMKLARRLVETVNQPCDLEGVVFSPSITLGGVLAPDSAVESRRLLLLADEALYAAKAAGRNCWRFSSKVADEREEPTLLDVPCAPETVYLD